MIIFINDSDLSCLQILEHGQDISLVGKDREFQSAEVVRQLANGEELHRCLPRIRKTKGFGIPYEKLRTLPSARWIEVTPKGDLIREITNDDLRKIEANLPAPVSSEY